MNMYNTQYVPGRRRNGGEALTSLHQLVLYSILLVCCVTDLRFYKIYNPVIFAGLILGLAYQISAAGLAGILIFVKGMAIPIVLLFPLFIFRMFGAGDIKLLSVVGGFLGIHAALICMLFSFFTAALYSIVKIIVSRNLRERLVYFYHYIHDTICFRTIKPYIIQGESGNHIIHFSIFILISVLLFEGGFS